MSQVIGTLELTSIVRGVEAGDAILKSVDVDLLVSKAIYPGKLLFMFGGNISAVQQVIATETFLAGDMLVDSLVPPNIHAGALPVISGLNSVDKRWAVGTVEIWNVAACICAVDRAVKTLGITLVHVHITFGIDGKCYMVVAGDVSDMSNAATIAGESMGEKGLLVHRSVVLCLHEGMW